VIAIKIGNDVPPLQEQLYQQGYTVPMRDTLAWLEDLHHAVNMIQTYKLVQDREIGSAREKLVRMIAAHVVPRGQRK